MNEVNMCGIATLPKKMSQTEQELERARGQKNMLFDTITLLSERLKPVLRPQNPCTSEDCLKEEALTDIAQSFRGLGSDFSLANSQLRDLINRLEI